MKIVVQKLIELSNETSLLKQQINDRVRQLAVEFENIDSERFGGQREVPTKPESIDEWEISGNSVFVKWSELKSGKGHVGGYFEFPAIYVYDNELLAAFKTMAKEVAETRKQVKNETERLEKIRQFNKLKKELGM